MRSPNQDRAIERIRSTILRAAALAALASVALSCGTQYHVVQQATPNPFLGRPTFVFAPLVVAVTVRDPGWPEAEETIFPSMVQRFASRSPFEVHTLDEGPPPVGAFVIETRLDSISGYRSGWDSAAGSIPTTNLFVRFSVRFVGRTGVVYDHVFIEMPGFSTGGGFAEACRALGANMADRIEFYLDGRMGRPRGRAHQSL